MWLWPDMIGNGSALTRMGRVVFWLGICIAAPIFAVGLYLGFVDGRSAFSTMIGLWAFAFAVFLAGRGLCYVFAGE